MKREKYEALLDAVKKGVAFKGIEVLERPVDRPGYKWVPLYDIDSNAVGWEEVVDYDWTPSANGTYIDPIGYDEGMEVIEGLWYTDCIDIWEAIKTGTPVNFNDKEYFDIID